jgi:hypothetical protein
LAAVSGKQRIFTDDGWWFGRCENEVGNDVVWLVVVDEKLENRESASP